MLSIRRILTFHLALNFFFLTLTLQLTNFQILQVLGRPDLEDDLLTADVEEEYDALNDETFGQAANGKL